MFLLISQKSQFIAGSRLPRDWTNYKREEKWGPSPYSFIVDSGDKSCSDRLSLNDIITA